MFEKELEAMIRLQEPPQLLQRRTHIFVQQERLLAQRISETYANSHFYL